MNKVDNYLKDLEEGLKNLEKDDLFKSIMEGTETVLGIKSEEFSKEIQVNLTTVNRWKAGETTPFPLMRRGIYTWLKKKVEESL